MRKAKRHTDSGSWKIAFGDLCICLMCTFLVLWIYQVTSQEERKILVDSLNSQNKTHQQATKARLDTISPLDSRVNSKDHRTQNYDLRNTSLIKGEYNTMPELELLAKTVADKVQQLNYDDTVFIQVIPDGVKIAFHDHQIKQRMFSLGSASLTYFFEDLLINFTPMFAELENAVTIAGHTDATVFANKSQSNWQLSSDRANTVREVMVNSGLRASSIVQVVGLSSTQPLDSKNTLSSINRRVEFIILTEQARQRMQSLYSPTKLSITEPKIEKTAIITDMLQDASRLAVENQPVSRLDKM